MKHKRKKLTGRVRKTKLLPVKRGRRAECDCISRSGKVKVLYTEHFQATQAAGLTMGPEGKMWQVYKCPSKRGWHISTVRWDPWSGVDKRVENA